MPKVLICPKCGYENNPANLQCSSCKSRFYPTLECPKCGEHTPPELGECILCGYKFIIIKEAGEEHLPPAPSEEEKMMAEAFKDLPELLAEEKKRPDTIILKKAPVVKPPVKRPVKKVEPEPPPEVEVEKPEKPEKIPVLQTKQRVHVKRRRKSFINGLRHVIRHPATIAKDKRLKIRFIAIVVIIFVIISSVLLMFEISRRDKIKIDGSFDDWNGIPRFEFSSSGKGIADITSAASVRGSEGLYLYIRVGDLITGGRKVLITSYVDTDGNPATGYLIQGTGADIRIDFQTDIGDGAGYVFQGDNQLLFNWTSAFSVQGEVSGSELELGPIPAPLSEHYHAVFTTVDDHDARDISDYPIAPGPVITLEQKPLLHLLPSGERDVLEIVASSHGGESTLNSIEMENTPVEMKLAPVTPLLPMTISSTPVTFKVRADVSQVQSGSFVSIKIRSASASGSVYVFGEELKGYAIAPPQDIRIDGAFDDWKKVNITRHPIDRSVRDGLDITTTGKSNETGGLALLLGVRDNLFLGTPSPMNIIISGGGGGGGIPSTPTSGEDIAYILMDFDKGALSLRVDIHGKHGKVTGSVLYELRDSKWEKITTLDVGSNRTSMETLVPSTYIGVRQSVKISYQIFGWNDIGEGLLLDTGFDARPVEPKSVPQFMYTPIVSDISPGSFKVSWVSDQPVNASIEYCSYSPGVCDSTHFPASPSVSYDTLEFLQNGTSLVEITGLSPGTQYIYRAKARNSANEISYSPSSAPYPSVTTKTSTSAGFNPGFLIQPYHDVNNNYQYDSSVDKKQSYFLVYLNHTGAETLVGRGDPQMVVIIGSNLRNNDAVGDPHPLVQGDIVSFFVAGLYNDGSGTSLWVNTTATLNIPWVDQPIEMNIRTESVPDVHTGVFIPVMTIFLVFVLTLKKRWTHPPSGSKYP